MSLQKGYGILFVLSAPSGTGKTTVAEKVIARVPGIRRSVSTTTRPIRPGEKDGRDYLFVAEDRFREMVKNGEFVEWASVHGNLYGTATAAISVSTTVASDKAEDLLLVIDVQGAKIIKEKGLDAVFIFLLPPSMKELRSRLGKRGTEGRDTVDIRLEEAKREIAASGFYDYMVVNSNLDGAVKEVEAIILAERSKRRRGRLKFPDYELPQ